jgi:hypothetical protein
MAPMPKGSAIALAAVLALTIGAAPSAAAAKPACKAGQLQVKQGKRTACKAVKAKATTAPLTAARAAAPKPAALRKRAPKRLRAKIPVRQAKRLDAAVRKVAAQASLAAARRPAAASDCASAPTRSGDGTQTTENGVKVTGQVGDWRGTDGATSGFSNQIRAELGKGAMATTVKECTSWDTCPDASGNVHGSYELVVIVALEAQDKDMKAVIRSKLTVEADLVGHVGGDGRVKTYDYTADGYGEVRAQAFKGGKLVAHVPASTVRTRYAANGLDPRAEMRGLNPKGSVTARGPHGSQLNGDAKRDVEMVSQLYVWSDISVRNHAGDALLKAEVNWYDNGACLDVVFDPPTAKVKPGQQLPVGVKVKAKDGAEVAASYDATPADGAVGPPTGTTAATVTWTAPNQLDDGVFPTFKIVAVSNRGRALGTHTAQKAEENGWWRITFTGTGEYHRYEPRGIPYPQLWADHTFAWETRYEPARIPYDDAHPEIGGYWGSQSVSITGELHGKRTDGGGTGTCASTPDPTDQIGRIEVKQAGDGYDIGVVPFFMLKPVSDAGCGTFDDMLLWGQGTQDRMTADIHVSSADLQGTAPIVRTVKPARPLKQCDGGEVNGDFACTHTADWSGTVRLERTDPPAGG